jgi:erythromycin esterase-like protein
MAGSWERLFHDVDLDRFFLDLRGADVRAALATSRLERAIGVVYKPETERASHYFRASLADQFDAVIHVDRTHALEPLEPWSVSEEDLPETYPTGV